MRRLPPVAKVRSRHVLGQLAGGFRGRLRLLSGYHGAQRGNLGFVGGGLPGSCRLCLSVGMAFALLAGSAGAALSLRVGQAGVASSLRPAWECAPGPLQGSSALS